jgi:hypothetical protein
VSYGVYIMGLTWRKATWKTGKEMEDNIMMDLVDYAVRWMKLAQDRVQWCALVIAVLKLWIPGLPDIPTSLHSGQVRGACK